MAERLDDQLLRSRDAAELGDLPGLLVRDPRDHVPGLVDVVGVIDQLLEPVRGVLDLLGRRRQRVRCDLSGSLLRVCLLDDRL